MNATAEKLNEMIDIFGFGTEFGLEDLSNYYPEAENMLEKLIDNDLIERNPLSGKYYLTDIFTCNNFLSQHLLKNEPEKADEKITVSLYKTIEKNELTGALDDFKGLEDDIEKIEIESENEILNIDAKLTIKESSVDKLIGLDWTIKKQ